METATAARVRSEDDRHRHLMPRGVSPANAYTFAALAVVLTVFMVLEPEVAFSSAVEGLKVWWDIVFPALLPFFIGSEILIGLGVVHFMGVLLEPFMRPLFNVPGAGSFVMAMGLASGYPIGSVLTARLRRQNLCNKEEAERLMSFTNTADPLFMSGAVCVGMFRTPGLAPVIMAAHYLSSVSLGLIMRFHARHAPRSKAPYVSRTGNIFYRALYALVEARERDGRPFGQLVGDAVKQSVNTLLLIGGFIMLFSVIIGIMEKVSILALLSGPVERFLVSLGLDPSLSKSMVSGLFEITIGTQHAASSQAPMVHRAMAASAVIAWSGLSVHAQVAAMIQGTDIKMNAYIMARVIHAALAAAYTLPLFRLLAPNLALQAMAEDLVPVLQRTASSWAARLNLAGASFLLAFGALVVFGFVLCMAGRRPCRRPL